MTTEVAGTMMKYGQFGRVLVILALAFPHGKRHACAVAGENTCVFAGMGNSARLHPREVSRLRHESRFVLVACYGL
jgi:hypothetical protein